MAFTDYNKYKDLTADSVSGTPTVGKATPIIVTDGTESTTGNGNIQIDASNVSSASDIAVYDSSETLRDYEIENPGAIGSGTISGELIIWVYGSWVRDGTVQAKLVYGNGPSTSEENVTGTWNNTGQDTVAVYHLNESSGTTIDSTSNNNDSTNTIGTTYDVSGEFDSARSFDGSDDEIIIPDDTSLDVTNITLVSWIKWDGGNSNNARIVNKNDSSNQEVYSFAKDQFVDSDDSMVLRLYIDGSFTNLDDTTVIPSSLTQYVGTYNGSTAELYRDGSSVNSTSVSGTIDTGSATLNIGGTNGNTVDQFDGDIDEVRIYSQGKDSDWIQADYDASPKAGQVFFSQSTAQTVSTTTVGSVKQTDSNGVIQTDSSAVIKTQ